MTLIPAFEIGVCNAWIYMLFDVMDIPKSGEQAAIVDMEDPDFISGGS